MTRGVRPAQLSQFMGLKNKIINGAFEVAQRGTSFTGIVSTVKTLDRWTVRVNVDGVVRADLNAVTPQTNDYGYSLKIMPTTVGTNAASAYTDIIQAIEGYNFRTLIGTNAVLSFYAFTNKPGVYYVRVANSGTDRCFIAPYTMYQSNVWERKTITIPLPASTVVYGGGTWNYTNGVGLYLSFTLRCGSNLQTATFNQWITGSFMAGSNQTNIMDNVANYFYLAKVQLTANDTPDFEERGYADELRLCQRYYQVLGGANGSLYYYSYYVTNTGSFGTSYTLPTPMRTFPVSAKNGTWLVSNCTQPGVSCSDNNSFNLFSTSTLSSTFNGWQCNSADDTLTFDAEF